MEKSKLVTWMRTLEYPHYLSIMVGTRPEGHWFHEADPGDFTEIYPTKECAGHPVASTNWREHIDTLEGFELPPPPKTVSLQEAVEAELPKEPKKRTRKAS